MKNEVPSLMTLQTRQRSRGQAALEFLSTYGFAFLLILVMIGALSYFGILNPQRLVPDRCISDPQFPCQDYIIRTGTGSNGNVTAFFLNNAGATTVVSALTVSVPELGITSVSGCTGNATYSPGQRITLSCTNLGGAGAVTTGRKVKVMWNMTYNEPGRFAKTAGGEILATVQP